MRALHSCHARAHVLSYASFNGGGGRGVEARMELTRREGEEGLEGGVGGGDAGRKPSWTKGASAAAVPSSSGKGAIAHDAQQGVGGVGTSGEGAGTSSSSGSGGGDGSTSTGRWSWGRSSLRGWPFGYRSSREDEAQARAVAEEEGQRARAEEEAVGCAWLWGRGMDVLSYAWHTCL
eukprot:scaffold255876_cov19-Tisochrysis_lutea.AAC.1